jgi:cellulose biosynthesis protein BcsQ
VSRTFHAFRRSERATSEAANAEGGPPRLRVVSVSSNKGGVGKTAIATNLAVYLRALREELPILLLGLDEQSMIDRMFAFDPDPGGETIADAIRRGSLDGAIRLGQYGVHYVPSSPEVFELKSEIRDPFFVRDVLAATHWNGVVVIDTKSDFEILTRGALAASDLAIVVVKDHASLIEAQRTFELLEDWGMPARSARILLSLMDRRVRYREGVDRDILALLVSEIRALGLPLFDGFISRSPKVEGLYTNPGGRALSILHGAPKSLVHTQMLHLADSVLDELQTAPATALGPEVLLQALTPQAAKALPVRPLRLNRFPVRIGRLDPSTHNDVAIPDRRPWQVSKRHAELVEHDGRIGVVDLGSHTGTRVDGQPLGGRSGDRGPRFFEGDRGRLVLGTAASPYVYAVEILAPPPRGKTGP